MLAVGQVRQTRSSLWIPAIWPGAILFILYTTTYKWLLPQWFEVAEHATPVERGLTQPYSQCAYSHVLLLCNSPSQTRQTAVQHTSQAFPAFHFPRSTASRMFLLAVFRADRFAATKRYVSLVACPLTTCPLRPSCFPVWGIEASSTAAAATDHRYNLSTLLLIWLEPFFPIASGRDKTQLLLGCRWIY